MAIEILAIALVVISLFWDAPLEELADPMHTPNPAKAPWYFLGLQELLHYFPPVVAGVLIPTLVVLALIVIPYFNINIEAEGVWLRNRAQAAAHLCIVVAGGVYRLHAGLRRLRGADPDAADRAASCCWRRASSPQSPAPLPALAGLEAALVLDHDLVSGAGGGPDGDRNVLPRPGLVLGLALEELDGMRRKIRALGNSCSATARARSAR